MAGIYIHIPYCKKRCVYCDFFTQTDMVQRVSYVDAVCKEISLRKNYIGAEPIETIYWGGGTPSLLSREDFVRVFEAIFREFEVVPDAEITLEANPDDLDSAYIRMLRSLPFNRISIGIQSFDDDELLFLGRRHTAERAISAIKDAQQAGFENISADLIYGLPGQTTARYIESLQKLIALNVQHISAYHLTYEKDTPLYTMLDDGRIDAVDEEVSLDMFSAMIELLKDESYIHYEISNFAKDGFYSRHNTSYWKDAKYLGIGAGAHSYNVLTREKNVSSIPLYISGVKIGDPAVEREILDEKTRYNEFVMTRLRTMWGINLSELKINFGDDMLKYCLNNIEAYLAKGLLRNEKERIVLTSKGIFTCDMIISDMMKL
ncbi:radical SAM family heme chaperone HemW [Dysgonomonas sp. 520]|uniref:radical SAM family heme chaperone HemW n=1 Tax=Dysgonomonas sp. 520 TaxID=2302931 RepID=UPI0013D6ED53|nr:radical SAM family heme chaperone HemW [Dysgonomonas sp. 520]NDW08102.1 radical SAM family heme chaperone HemW [Dysgonomonas sp. 520]